jgi:3-oxoacyl-[acyl-carrier protein] reductase
VVTGGSRGIGRAIALGLAQAGADVAILYAGNTERAESACAEAAAYGIRAQAYQCDVADFTAVQTVVAQVVADFPHVDILVNNAGVIRDSLLLRLTEADFDAVVDVSLKGTFNVTRHLLRTLLRSPHGRIINIASVSGLTGTAGQANYAAAKAGVIGLTKSVAREVAGRGVTCNVIAPGYIDTDMTRGLNPAVKDKLAAAIPLGYAGTADDIAHAVVFLASDLARYITGEVLRVDGGMAM